jgi:HK97 family phage major capsid protein
MNLMELKQQHKFALDKAESILGAGKAELTDAESRDINMCMREAQTIRGQIEKIEKQNTITSMFQKGPGKNAVLLVDGGRRYTKPLQKELSAEYANDFFDYIASNGTKASAALYEGADGSGGYAVPITVDDQIVPLAPQEMAVRRLATVIPTAMDIKLPQKQSFGTTSAKAELASFSENEPSLAQIVLSAFMAGNTEEVSWELAQDVPSFQAFCVDDLVLAQQMFEENWYCNGTGTGQPQGLFTGGAVGAGVVEEPDSNGNLVSINATLDVQGALNAIYHPGASWLMSRATSIGIRKAQVETNLFNPVWTRVGNQDYLHGYPVQFSAYAPVAARGATPVLFGDFKRGYVIGDRGGSGINVKVLDQPLATQGILVLLAYRRTDGRVRRSEAIQGITIAAS